MDADLDVGLCCVERVDALESPLNIQIMDL